MASREFLREGFRSGSPGFYKATARYPLMGGLPLATGLRLFIRLGPYGLPVVEQRDQNDPPDGVPQRRRKQETN